MQTPLNKLRGFELITVWLYDPDGVTNYFAQTDRNSRAAPERAAATEGASDLTVLPPIPDDYAPEMTAWGDPDFRGTWPIDHLKGPPLRDEAQGDRHFLTEEDLPSGRRASIGWPNATKTRTPKTRSGRGIGWRWAKAVGAPR